MQAGFYRTNYATFPVTIEVYKDGAWVEAATPNDDFEHVAIACALEAAGLTRSLDCTPCTVPGCHCDGCACDTCSARREAR